MELAETIDFALHGLIETAETNEDYDINVGIAEVKINGKLYQIQLSLIYNKEMWCNENEIRYSEASKINK